MKKGDNPAVDIVVPERIPTARAVQRTNRDFACVSEFDKHLRLKLQERNL